MLKACIRWLAVRGDALANFLITSVTAGALLAMQSPGGRTCYIINIRKSFIVLLVTNKEQFL